MTNPKTLTLAALIEESAAKYSKRIALSFSDDPSINYASLKKQIVKISDFLKNKGIVHGDRVGILSENSPNWGITYFAISTMGAISVPILPDFHASEVQHILRHSGCKALFVSERQFYKIEDMKIEALETTVLIDNFSIINPDISKASLKKLLADGSRELQRIKNLAMQFAGFMPTDVKEDDIASIIYTSGTTGHSKGVMLTHKNIVSNAIATLQIVDVDHTDIFLSILPLAHVYECTLGLVLPLLAGAAVYYIKKPPTAAVLMPALNIVKPTAMLSVPLIIEKMYKSKILPEIKSKTIVRMAYKIPGIRKKINRIAGKKLLAIFGGRLKLFCIGGASIAPDAELFLRESGFPYSIGYGLTETSPLVAGSNPQKTKYKSTGPALPDVEIMIERVGKSKTEGEILVKSPGIMKGYYNEPELTKEVITKDGWFRTGDFGAIDKNKYLYIKGRLKNVILGPSGENIYPEGIESVINRSEYVLESLVFQQQNNLVARVYLNYEKIDEDISIGRLSEKESKEHINKILELVRKETNENVSSFSKINKIIEQTEQFEKTPTQKIKRYLYV
jgi:long-chain acyl-CoA synthetase